MEGQLDEAKRRALRGLPSVEEVLGHPAAGALLERYPRLQVVEAVRKAIDASRRRVLDGYDGAQSTEDLTADALLSRAAALLESWAEPGLRPVLNLTGVVVHTNLGRSALAEDAIGRVVAVARAYSNLEYDLLSGARGHREGHVEALLTRLTGAEAGFVVNNNAGAVLLVLMGLAGGGEVLVSRGQLVEIGGAFRLPDIMRAGGVKLVEVGTTNRTRIGDFEAAITDETALILRVHTSNYRIVGFTEEAELGELVDLGRSNDILVADDLGSGALHEWEGFRGEPTVAASLRTGADVVCFSGDKLLGGPQAGVLVGRGEVVDRLRRHPVARALRADKMTLAALEATLELYQDPERARTEIPTLRYLRRAPEETAALAATLLGAIEGRSSGGFILEVEESSARAGGGSMPLLELPSHAVRIRFPEPPVLVGSPGGTAAPAGAAGGPAGSGSEAVGISGTNPPTVSALDAELRKAPVPVVARISQDSLHLDVISLEETDVEVVAGSVAWAIDRLTGRPAGTSGS
jgi:L-seryl-tRNA(Ser) seleniumtransferase